jgi:hypothetical protein
MADASLEKIEALAPEQLPAMCPIQSFGDVPDGAKPVCFSPAL